MTQTIFSLVLVALGVFLLWKRDKEALAIEADRRRAATAAASEPAEPKLIACPDCGTEISTRAVACPKCGAPTPKPRKIDVVGAWCPNCGNRDSEKRVAGALAFRIIAAIVLVVPVVILFAMASTTARLGGASDPIGMGLTLFAGVGVLVPAAILSIIWALLPRHWNCRSCRNVWRA